MLSSLGGKGRAEGVESPDDRAFRSRSPAVVLTTKIVPGKRLQTSLHSRRTMRTPIQSPLAVWRGGRGEEGEEKSGNGWRATKDRQRSNVSTEFVTGIRSGDRVREKWGLEMEEGKERGNGAAVRGFALENANFPR